MGLTTVILDENNLLPVLGAAAGRNTLLPVQVLKSGAFLSLGTVVSAIASASYGTPVLQARLIYDDGTEAGAREVKFGTLELLPLPAGRPAAWNCILLGRADVGFGPGRGPTVTVSGGALGVVFDGRGRPISLPQDHGRRRDLIKNWYWTLGG